MSSQPTGPEVPAPTDPEVPDLAKRDDVPDEATVLTDPDDLARDLVEVAVEPSIAARVGAEALGTFALVLVTLGVTLYLPLTEVGPLGVALAAGLTLAAVTAALGHVSGAHVNPVVTLASAAAGRVRWPDAALYLPAQVLGGGAAAAALFLTVPDGLPRGLGLSDTRAYVSTVANTWGETSELWTRSQQTVAFDARAAFLVELCVAALLAAVVLGAAHRRSATLPTAPLAIGAAYAALLLVALPVTGGALNPARSTAAALFAEPWALAQLWLFWAAPLLGGLIAGLLYRAFREPETEVLVLDEPED